MAKITKAFIRRQFLIQFAHQSYESRSGTLEALTVMHETILARDETATEVNEEKEDEQNLNISIDKSLAVE